MPDHSAGNKSAWSGQVNAELSLPPSNNGCPQHHFTKQILQVVTPAAGASGTQQSCTQKVRTDRSHPASDKMTPYCTQWTSGCHSPEKRIERAQHGHSSTLTNHSNQALLHQAILTNVATPSHIASPRRPTCHAAGSLAEGSQNHTVPQSTSEREAINLTCGTRTSHRQIVCNSWCMPAQQHTVQTTASNQPHRLEVCDHAHAAAYTTVHHKTHTTQVLQRS